MEYVLNNTYSRACASFQDFIDRGLQENYWTRGSSGKDKIHHYVIFSVAIMIWPVQNIHFTNDNGYLYTVVTTNLLLYWLWLTSIITE